MNEDFHDGARQVSGSDTVCAILVFVAVEVALMGYISLQIVAG